MPLKFLHAADIHLDSPLRGLERYEGAPVDRIRQATRRALENLVALALEEQVDFVLIAGDLYDGDWKDYNTGLCVVRQMSRLGDAGIPVFLIAGNHDAANRITRSLRLPANVRLFPAEAPATVGLEDLGVAIHGQSFARAAVTEDLSANYPPARRGFFNIGLLHTCATGREGHENYAPCKLEGLAARQYDYWALGHIHQREVLQTDPLIVFPGNLQGRHIRETGAKGCLLVTVNDAGRAQLEFRPLDVLRWELCAIDAGDVATADAALERVEQQLQQAVQRAAGLPLAVRIEIRGPCPAHDVLSANPAKWTNEVRSRADAVGSGEVWVEKVKLRTTPLQAHDPAESLNGPIGELVRLIEELKADDEKLQELRKDLAEFSNKLGADLLHDRSDGTDFGSVDWLRTALEEVRPLLVHRLLARESAR